MLHGVSQRRATLMGGDGAVFLGIERPDMAYAQPPAARASVYAVTSDYVSAAAGRLSFVLGMQGPCESSDTACASALVALHNAAHAVRAGECGVAVTLALSLKLTPCPTLGAASARIRMLSVDGRCKTLDRRADGYARSEGVGSLVLRPMEGGALAAFCGSAVRQELHAGESALHVGAVEGRYAACALLLDHGASLTRANGTLAETVCVGWLPVHSAAQSESAETLALLLHPGAELHATTRTRRRPDAPRGGLVKPVVGPEAVAGSSRTKGGTATLILADAIGYRAARLVCSEAAPSIHARRRMRCYAEATSIAAVCEGRRCAVATGSTTLARARQDCWGATR